MPIPILLAGLGIAAGVIGAGGHMSAKETNEKAQKISHDAQNLYNNEKNLLETLQSKTEKDLLQLGYSKKKILDCSMEKFLKTYDKIKNISFTDSIGLNEISNFMIDQQDVIEIKEMSDIYSSALKSGVTGVATGTVVALAASGSLSIVTGGLSLAGSALAAGEITAAAGIAGSALSFGAAMTPLAAVAAPVVLFTGISASIKADENLEKAETMYAEAEAAVEKMKVSETLCKAISDRSNMFNDLLVDLDGMFLECVTLLDRVIRKKEGRFFKKELNSDDFTKDELKLASVTRSLAGAVKSILDTPIVSKDGTLSNEFQEVYNHTNDGMTYFNKSVEDVKNINYNLEYVSSVQDKGSRISIPKEKEKNEVEKYVEVEKNKWVSILLCIFTLVGHKFYEGKIFMGIIYIFTIGFFGIGYFIDLCILISKPNPYYVKKRIKK